MKVQFNKSVGGNPYTYAAGDVADITDSTRANAMVNVGLANKVPTLYMPPSGSIDYAATYIGVVLGATAPGSVPGGYQAVNPTILPSILPS